MNDKNQIFTQNERGQFLAHNIEIPMGYRVSKRRFYYSYKLMDLEPTDNISV